jgi:MinD-like ATPase involved in chromosome partitioning or flagellar assembly
MVIAVWGRDGIGKSTLCDTLGKLFAKKGVTVIIDTDLTQPTLPMRLNGVKVGADASLGKAIGIGAMDAAPYLHQHPKMKTLFYAGLSDHDEYLSYELGLEADNAAQDFVELCEELADTVILDLSGQRNDPFLPGVLIHSYKVIALFTPDVQGICWFNSVKPLIGTMNAQERILPVVVKMYKQHDLSAVEKATNTKLVVAMPYVREVQQGGISDGTTRSAIRYHREAKKLQTLLKGVEAK